MRKGSTSFGACEVRCWRWLFGNKITVSLSRGAASDSLPASRVIFLEREFFIDNLLVRIHFIIVMIRWTGLAPWEFEFPFPGSLIHLPRLFHHRSLNIRGQRAAERYKM